MTPARWTMDRNLVLQAGAGTGKTHALVTLALHILSGATARRTPVPAGRLVALTFTEKAGAEMRSRLLERLAPLAEGKTPLECGEIDLAKSFADLKVKPPTPTEWRRIRRDVPLASIGTFHSFCGGQLRRLAGAGVDPGFEVLAEEDATALFHDASQEHVLAALADGDAQIRQLVDQYEATGENGVIGLVRSVLASISEEGRSPGSLDDGRFSDAAATEYFARALRELRASVEGLNDLNPKFRAKHAGSLSAISAAAASLNPSNAEEVLANLAALRKTFTRPSKEAGAPVIVFDEAREEMESAVVGIQAAPLGRGFVALAIAVERRYSEAKRQRSAIDFADMQRLLRDRLRARGPEARHHHRWASAHRKSRR